MAFEFLKKTDAGNSRLSDVVIKRIGLALFVVPPGRWDLSPLFDNNGSKRCNSLTNYSPSRLRIASTFDAWRRAGNADTVMLKFEDKSVDRYQKFVATAIRAVVD